MNKLQNLEELVRIAADRILSHSEKFDYIVNDQVKKRLYITNPECFISLKRLGRDTTPYLLPLCNRGMIIDHRAIDISYKLVQKLLDDNKGLYDINDLQTVLSKLELLKNRYNKIIPKPPQQAARKALITKMFNNIKGYLKYVYKK
jgi:hypothetical protein